MNICIHTHVNIILVCECEWPIILYALVYNKNPVWKQQIQRLCSFSDTQVVVIAELLLIDIFASKVSLNLIKQSFASVTLCPCRPAATPHRVPFSFLLLPQAMNYLCPLAVYSVPTDSGSVCLLIPSFQLFFLQTGTIDPQMTFQLYFLLHIS